MAKRYKLSHAHRRALLVSLGRAGVQGTEAQECIERLAAIARNAHRRVNHLLPNVAIVRVDVGWWRCQLAAALSEQFECYTPHVDYLFARALGKRIGAKRHKRSEGRARTVEFLFDLNDIWLGAEYSCSQALYQLWNSRNGQDRAIRQFARAVMREWQETTRRRMVPPSVSGSVTDNQFEDFSKNHPLRVLLDSVGISLRIGLCIRRLMSCASGEALEPLEYS